MSQFQTALLQIDVDLALDPATGLAGGAVGAFFTTLVVGAILVALAPKFTDDRMAAVLEDPVGTFVYGIVVLLLLIVLIVVLVISFVGIVVAIPLFIVAYVVWAIGSTIAYLAIADRLVGRDDGWTKAIAVAAALSGGIMLTGVGGILGLAIGAAGFGAVLEDQL